MIKADQAGRLIQISPVVKDIVPSEKEGDELITIKALYRSEDKSVMELFLQTSKPLESKEAFSSYPIETILRLNGKGLNKTPGDAVTSLGRPISMTIAWHLKSKGIDIKDMNLSEVESSLREIIGPGADMILAELFEGKDMHKDAANPDDRI